VPRGICAAAMGKKRGREQPQQPAATADAGTRLKNLSNLSASARKEKARKGKKPGALQSVFKRAHASCAHRRSKSSLI
jgi:hypothetical protein